MVNSRRIKLLHNTLYDDEFKSRSRSRSYYSSTSRSSTKRKSRSSHRANSRCDGVSYSFVSYRDDGYTFV